MNGLVFLGDVWLDPDLVVQIRVEHTLVPTGAPGLLQHRARVCVDPYDCVFPWEEVTTAEERRDEVAAAINYARQVRALYGQEVEGEEEQE